MDDIINIIPHTYIIRYTHISIGNGTGYILTVLTDGEECPALSKTAHAAQALTNIATAEAVGISKRNSNCARPTEGQNASSRSPVDPDSDVSLTDSFGGSDINSEYLE